MLFRSGGFDLVVGARKSATIRDGTNHGPLDRIVVVLQIKTLVKVETTFRHISTRHLY